MVMRQSPSLCPKHWLLCKAVIIYSGITLKHYNSSQASSRPIQSSAPLTWWWVGRRGRIGSWHWAYIWWSGSYGVKRRPRLAPAEPPGVSARWGCFQHHLRNSMVSSEHGDPDHKRQRAIMLHCLCCGLPMSKYLIALPEMPFPRFVILEISW